jgi:hypothetical protein
MCSTRTFEPVTTLCIRRPGRVCRSGPQEAGEYEYISNHHGEQAGDEETQVGSRKGETYGMAICTVCSLCSFFVAAMILASEGVASARCLEIAAGAVTAILCAGAVQRVMRGPSPRASAEG